MMSHWKKYRLEELADITSSKRIFAADYVPQGILFYRSKEIIEKSLGQTISNPLYITQDRFKEIKIKFGVPQKGDVLLSAVGERAGVSYVVRNEPEFYFKDGNLIWLRKLSDKFNPFYFHYWVLSDIGQDILNSMMIGSAQKALTIIGLKNLEIDLPDLPTQTRIASILSSLDDKIELNRHMNQTLEQMAQALFNHYFVDNIDPDNLPEGWELLKLGQLIKIKNGFAFKGTDFVDSGIPVLKIKNVKGGKVILNRLSYISEKVASNAKNYRIKQFDLLITMTGNRFDGTPETWVGKVGIFHRDGEYLLNQRVSILKIIDNDKLSPFFLCQLLSSESFQYYFASNATSSGGQANISPDQIYNTKILMPSASTMLQYNNKVENLYKKIFSNELEVENLTAIRDTLLPKLMSGEIDIDKGMDEEQLMENGLADFKTA